MLKTLYQKVRQRAVGEFRNAYAAAHLKGYNKSNQMKIVG